MGSLMAGWDSHVPDPNVVKFSRNKSLTKEEINAFWKSKKLKEEEHLKDISLLSPRSQKILFEEAAESETDLDEKIIRKNGWWVSSNSAFLNEPPVIASEGTQQRYASQFHVGRVIGSGSTGRTGHSTEICITVSCGPCDRFGFDRSDRDQCLNLPV